MSNVKSVEMPNGKPVSNPHTTTRGGPAPEVAAALIMLLFGAPLWAIGAYYSLTGWVLGLNIAADVIGLPHVVAPAGGWAVAVFVPLGLVYSILETHGRVPSGAPAVRVAVGLAIVLTHLSDVGSTLLAALLPSAGAWPIALWAAGAVWPAALWALVLTYTPELLILGGVALLRRQLR